MFRKLFFSVLIISASASQAEDLMDIYRQALVSDPEIRAAEFGYRAVTTSLDQADAAYRPTIEFNSTWSYISQDSKPSNVISPTDEGDITDYTLSLKQPIFNYNALVLKKQADINNTRAETEFYSIQQEVMLKAAERYFAYLSARTALEFARSEKAAIAKQLEQANKRFEVGLIAITDVHEAQAAYDLAVASEITAINLLDSASEALTEITGKPHHGLERVSKKLPLVSPDPESMGAWTDIALQQNLQLKALELQTQIAKQEIRLQKADHYPSLGLFANHNFNDNNIRAQESTRDAVGLELRIPIYEGGFTSAKVQEAAYLHSQAQENLEKLKRSVLRQARDAYRGVINGIGQVQALDQATISNTSALETTQAGFEVGTRTIVDVLLAQRGLFGARRDYNQARHEYILNVLRLKLAAGTLSKEDLQYFNSWLVDVDG
jgi:outer membrane protein